MIMGIMLQGPLAFRESSFPLPSLIKEPGLAFPIMYYQLAPQNPTPKLPLQLVRKFQLVL